MKRRVYNLLSSVFLLSVFLGSCQKDNLVAPPAQGDWIKGSEGKKLKTIEKQFRGFDMAMVETGYRYQTLYWAGQNGNWQYAEYQAGKINKAIVNGLERRPKRSKSANFFLNESLPTLQEAILSKDKAKFNESFGELTKSCNQCHHMENVPSFKVTIPTQKVSPLD